MSFDLVVWRSTGRRITPNEASQMYAAMCERPLDSFVPSREMAAFVAAVAENLAHDERSPDGSPWSAEPDVDQDSAIMTFPWSLGAQAVAVVRELANDQGFLCFDPQASEVYQPSEPDITASVSLELYDGRKFASPNEALIERSIRGISRDHWYAILEVGEDRYLQVGYGQNAGAPGGQYALEHRDGSPEHHWRAITPDVEAVVRAFLEYLTGEMNWTKRLSFKKIEP